MDDLKKLKDEVNILGRAEYRYDHLVRQFADDYLELIRAGYQYPPDIKIFEGWLGHLHREIRPGLLAAWKKLAGQYGFSLGDKISVANPGKDPVALYAVRLACHPGESVVHVSGFGVKKDGKHASAAVTAQLDEKTVVTADGKRLDSAMLEPIFFGQSSRLPNVDKLIADTIARLT